MASPPVSKAPASRTASSKASIRKQLMEAEVLEHATRLFAERGFAGTCLQDVASSMGLKRSALYYYFSSKEDLLDRLIQESVTGPAQDLKATAELPGLSPAERLHAMMRQHVVWVLTHTEKFLLMLKSQSALSAKSAQTVKASASDSLDAVSAVIQEGIELGQFRQQNARIAAFGVFGITNWAAWWFDPDGSESVDSIAEQLADQALASVESVAPSAETVLSPQSALIVVRRDLDRLQQALDGSRKR